MLKFLFSTGGRISRRDYALKYFVPMLATVVLLIFIEVQSDLVDVDDDIGPFSQLFLLLMIWPSIAITAKRLHDRDRSGWFQLITIIPLLNIWLLIELFFLSGSPGLNRYDDFSF